MKELLDGAKGLSRNPLGIVALFVGLVYGFASLLLGLASDRLQCAERLPLIWFIVLFPVLVLGVFYRLVTKYHGKLYSPRDYRDDAAFIRTLGSDQQAERIEAEVQVLQGRPEPQAPPAPPAPPVEPQPQPSLPPSIEPQPSRSANELRAKLREADRLGLLKVEITRGLVLQTQIAFGEDKSVPFDGLATSDNEYIAVEIKFLQEPWVSIQRVHEIFNRALAAEALLRRHGDNRRFRLLVVFVVDRDTGSGLSRLTQKVETLRKQSPVNVEFEAYFFDQLKQELGDAP